MSASTQVRHPEQPAATTSGRPAAVVEEVVEAPSVRPYAVARGRRPPTAAELPLEALVRTSELARATGGMATTAQERRALDLAADAWTSVAELSAHLRLPLPVTRVVVDALVRDGRLRLHTATMALVTPESTSARRAGPSRDLLLSVLDGIRSL